MKTEDIQNAQQGTGGAENKGQGRSDQKNQTANVSNAQQNDRARQAGLGRDRLTDIEDPGGTSERDDYAGPDNDDLNNKNLNASNDQ
jgi:hypothetical protein